MEKYTKITITVPRVSDWQEFRALRLEALQNEPHAFKNSYEQELQFTENNWKEKIINSSRYNRGEFFIIAKDNENIIGMVGAVSEKNNNVWKLHSVYVTQAYRGQGIGTALLEKIIQHIEIYYSGSMIELTVNTLQKPAITVYEKCGFSIKEILKNQMSGDGGLYTKLIMCRNFCPIHIYK